MQSGGEATPLINHRGDGDSDYDSSVHINYRPSTVNTTVNINYRPSTTTGIRGRMTHMKVDINLRGKVYMNSPFIYNFPLRLKGQDHEV